MSLSLLEPGISMVGASLAHPLFSPSLSQLSSLRVLARFRKRFTHYNCLNYSSKGVWGSGEVNLTEAVAFHYGAGRGGGVSEIAGSRGLLGLSGRWS